MITHIDTVVLTWNDGPLLETAVQSALVQDGVVPHVVVIDNASDDQVAVSAADNVTVVRNRENRGVAAGRNQGVDLGNAPFILLLDSDAELSPGCAAALVAALDADPDAGLAAPVFVGQPAEASAGREPSIARKLARGLGLTASYGRTDHDDAAREWPVDFAIGACQLIRRDAWNAVGGLDESFFYGPEDLDFCLRLRDHGFHVIQTAAAACHHPARRRNRSLFARGGLRHARALARHYARRARRSIS